MPLDKITIPVSEFGKSVTDKNLQLMPRKVYNKYEKKDMPRHYINYVKDDGSVYQLLVQLGRPEDDNCPKVMSAPTEDIYEDSKQVSYSFPLMLRDQEDIDGAAWLDEWLRRVCRDELEIKPNLKAMQTEKDTYKTWLRRPVESDDPENNKKNYVVFVSLNSFSTIVSYDSVSSSVQQGEDGEEPTTVHSLVSQQIEKDPLAITPTRAVVTLKLSHIDLSKRAGGMFYTQCVLYQRASAQVEEEYIMVGGQRVYLNKPDEGGADDSAVEGAAAAGSMVGGDAVEGFRVPSPPCEKGSRSTGGVRRQREGDDGAETAHDRRSKVPASGAEVDTAAAVVAVPSTVTDEEMAAAFES